MLAILSTTLMLVAGPAHADPKKDCITIAALPDSCLDQATADHIAQLEAERDEADQLRAATSAENAELRHGLWSQLDTIRDLRVEVFGLQAAVDVGNQWLGRQRLRIIRQRAKIHELRLVVRHLT